MVDGEQWIDLFLSCKYVKVQEEIWNMYTSLACSSERRVGGKEILVFHFTHYLFDLYLVLVSGYFLRVHVGFFFIYRRLLGQ